MVVGFLKNTLDILCCCYTNKVIVFLFHSPSSHPYSFVVCLVVETQQQPLKINFLQGCESHIIRHISSTLLWTI